VSKCRAQPVDFVFFGDICGDDFLTEWKLCRFLNGCNSECQLFDENPDAYIGTQLEKSYTEGGDIRGFLRCYDCRLWTDPDR